MPLINIYLRVSKMIFGALGSKPATCSQMKWCTCTLTQQKVWHLKKNICVIILYSINYFRSRSTGGPPGLLRLNTEDRRLTSFNEDSTGAVFDSVISGKINA